MATGKNSRWRELSVAISTVNNDVNSGDKDDSNNLNNIFTNITNRSAEKLQSNSIFHNFDTDNSNNRPNTGRSQIYFKQKSDGKSSSIRLMFTENGES